MGYFISDKFAVGLGVGFNYKKVKYDQTDKDVKTTSFGLNPYFRYFMCGTDKLKFYLQGEMEYLYNKVKNDVNETSTRYLSFGIKPGMAYSVSDKVTLTATYGYLGYQDFDNNHTAFNLNLSTNALLFGFIIKL